METGRCCAVRLGASFVHPRDIDAGLNDARSTPQQVGRDTLLARDHRERRAPLAALSGSRDRLQLERQTAGAKTS